MVTGRKRRRDAESVAMRYERLKDIVRLAVRLQAASGGLTLEDIQADFSVSRRTAERMRDAVEEVFGHLARVTTGDVKHHWRLRSDAVRRIVAITPEDLGELESAASALERAGLEERVGTIRDLTAKLQAMLRSDFLLSAKEQTRSVRSRPAKPEVEAIAFDEGHHMFAVAELRAEDRADGATDRCAGKYSPPLEALSGRRCLGAPRPAPPERRVLGRCACDRLGVARSRGRGRRNALASSTRTHRREGSLQRWHSAIPRGSRDPGLHGRHERQPALREHARAARLEPQARPRDRPPGVRGSRPLRLCPARSGGSPRSWPQSCP